MKASKLLFKQIKEMCIEDDEVLNDEERCFLPIISDKKEIILQGCGWCINLYPDGIYDWEDTTGG